VRTQAATRKIPVLGITGTGGAGKSSLTDELIRRLRLDQDDKLRVAIISIDPSRRKSGGALLGDRIRMNAINPWTVPLAEERRQRPTRLHALAGHARLRQRNQPGPARRDRRLQGAGFDLIVVETSGIGQGDAAIVPHVDVPMYVMTPEFGAASQLEKIDMLDFAEFVAINKFDRKGSPTPARRFQAGAAQQGSLGHAGRQDAGLRHHGGALQRRRRDRALPGAQAAPGRAGPGA
jgi:methylmalonyl-CoA mutase